MKTQFFKLLLITMAMSLASCKTENKVEFTDFKYADKPDAMTCGDMDTKLLREALYSFEDDIVNHYDAQNRNTSRAYTRLITESIINRLRIEDVISEHTVKVFEVLKQDKDLWSLNNGKSNLNYNSQLVNCIADNIRNERLKSTFNALQQTNSLTPKLIGEPIKSSSVQLINDKYLATFVALQYYYSKLFDVDLSTIHFDKPEASNIDFNKRPAATQPNTQNNSNN
ncbi:hypothetical protein RXV94_10255 [Yeosuana sp. MJ-SS3]|uniref:DUF4294 domain-containing protein n=1 Tax=Gilvirhabdus luticola TaxID=3079858 RepID=A0ABU3U8B8_9FLAO|nr:hypothetical protein [Yeosuana sp. MJ-SS3]MDU8886541.1 hypothetical protein [Yeosuana sp. MJ-SS3]